MLFNWRSSDFSIFVLLFSLFDIVGSVAYDIKHTEAIVVSWGYINTMNLIK